MRRTRSGSRDGKRVRSSRLVEMNVTNLVDVTMVILICFILVAPMLKHGVEIDLPRADAPGVETAEKHVVKVDKEEKIYLDEVRKEMKVLVEDLSRIAEREKDPVVYLEADKSLSYGTVMEVMSAIKEDNIVKVGLVTRQKRR